jgi:uncharacterized integral membrane protein
MLVLLLIIFALAGGTLAMLALENSAALSVDVRLILFGRHVPPLPLGVLLLLSFVLGALLLYIVTLLSATRDRRQLRALRKRVAELEALQAAQTTLPGQPGQPVQPGQMGAIPWQKQSTSPLIVPMPGTQTYRLQYLFPPPRPKREQDQGR